MGLSLNFGRTAALIIAVLIMGQSTVAQTPADVATRESSDETTGRARFVPADQLADVFAASPRGVFLPRDEYLSLVARARAARQQADDVPEPVIVRAAAYRIRQAGNHALVNLTITAEQFLNDWAIIEVPVGNLSLESATIAEQTAHVARVAGTDRIAIAHQGRGPFAVELTLSTPLGAVGSDRVAAFRTSGDIATTLTVDCPADRVLKFNDLELARPTAIDQPTKYSIPAGSFDQVRLKWTTESKTSDSESLVFASTSARLTLSADNLRWNSNSRVSVFGTAINQIVASVPGELEITSVESAGLESWKLEDDPDSPGSTRVILSYRQPFTADRVLNIQAVMTAVSREQWKVPALRFRKLTSHTGRLLVEHEQKLRLLADAQNGIRQITLNQPVSGEAFDFWLQDFDLRLAVKPRDRELFAEVNSRLNFDDVTVSFAADVTVETLNAPLFELPVRIPKGWQVRQLAGINNPAPGWRTSSADDVIVVEPLSPVPAAGLLGFQLQLTKTIDSPDTEQTLEIPVVSASDTLLVGGTYSISGATDLTVSPLEINGLAPIADDAGQTLFETQGTTYSGRVSVVRKPVRLASRAVIRTWLTERQKSVEMLLTVDVLNGTTRTLDLELPAALGADLRFTLQSITQVPGHPEQVVPGALTITEQSSTEPVDGIRPFRLTFDKRFVGAVTLRAFLQQPRQPDTRLSAPFLRVVGAIRQHGLIAFEAQPDQQIDTPDDLSASGLSVADAGLVPAPPMETGRRVALVYRFVQPDYQLELSETTFATETVPSAVVPLIENTSVISEGDLQQRQSRIHFRCSGVQTLRFVLPQPEQSYLWSTVLNGEPIEVRKDGSDYLVSVPTDSPTEEHVLEVLFESPQQASAFTGESLQDSVALKIDTDDGEVTPVDILQQQWDVRYPPTAMLLNHGAGFRPLRSVDQAGWLQVLPALLSAPTQDVLSTRGYPAVIWLLAFFVATALIVKKRWKTLAAVSIFAVVLILPLFQNARVAARRANTSLSVLSDDVEYVGDFESDDSALLPSKGNFEGSSGSVNPSVVNASPSTPAPGEQASEADAATEETERSTATQDADLIVQEFAESFAGMAPAQPPMDASGSSAQLLPPDLADQSLVAGRVVPRSGSARLSVKAQIAAPGDYQSMEFRSIGATAEAGRLSITIQPRARVIALRVIAASLVALICLLINGAPIVSRAAFLVIVGLGAVAAVPVAPNEWQSAVDGVLIGGMLGIVLWLTFGVCRCLTTCCRGLWSAQPPSPPTVTLKTTAKVVLLAVLCGGPLQAAPQGEPAAGDRSPSASGSDIAAARTPGGDDIILPYDPDQPELLADKVFLPQAEFLKLYRAANPQRLKTDHLPMPAQVVAAYYRSAALQQVRDTTWAQQFEARYVIQIASAAQPTVRLPLGAVAVQSATMDGRPVALTPVEDAPVQQAEATQAPAQQQLRQNKQQQSAEPSSPSGRPGSYEVSLSTPGLHVLDVSFSVAASVDGQVGRVTVPLRPVEMGTLSFELPAAGLDAAINGRSNVYRREGQTLLLPVAQAEQTVITWRPEQKSGVAETTFHSFVNSALSISDQGLTLESAVEISVRQGELSEITLQVPPDYAVQTIEGPEVAGWEAQPETPGRLRLLLKERLTGQTTIRLVLFRRQVFSREESRLAVPVPVITGATRDTGTVSLCAGSELEVRVDSLSAVSQINAGDVKAPAGSKQVLPRVLAWRYTRHPVAIGVRVFRDADQLQIRSLAGVQLEAQRQLWTTLVSATISGAPRRRLEIEVPEDFLALDVTANGLADWYYTDAAEQGVRLLNIQLQQARAGVVNVVVQGQTGRAQDEQTASLNPLRVRGATSSKTTVSIWLDAASEIASVNGGDWNRVGREVNLDPRIRKLQSDAPDISFQADGPADTPISLALRQAESSLAAESVTISTVTDTSVELTLGLNWKISGAATRTLAFQIPASLADVYDFQVPGLRRLQKTTNGDVTTVTINLQQPVSESLFVLGLGTLPLPESREIRPQQPEFFVPDGSTDRVSNQSHFWVIVNQSPGLLQPVDRESDGDQVQPDEIRTNMPEELVEQAVAIRRLKASQPQSAWQLSFPERQQVAPAIVALAAHTTVIAEDGSWRSRHRLQIRNESRQFLAVQMPEDSRLLYATVEGRPVRMASRVVGERPLHLVPIPQSGEVSRPVSVEFAIAGTATLRNLRAAGSDLPIPCPVIPAFRDDPEYGVTISRNTWQVYVPESWHTSVLDNPRQTNMVRANQAVLEDTIMLSGMENLKSILNAASSQGQVDNITIVNEIQRQSLLLESLRCNDLSVAQQRTEILDQAEVLFEQLNRDNKDQIDAVQKWQMEGVGVNSFLDQQALQQNGYNQRNSLSLMFGNSAQSVPMEQQPELFNFVLPTEPESKSRSGQQGMQSGKQSGRAAGKADGESRQSGGKALQKGEQTRPQFAPPINDNTSQLLNRRDSNRKTQSEQLRMFKQSQMAQGERPSDSATPALGSRQLTFPGQAADGGISIMLDDAANMPLNNFRRPAAPQGNTINAAPGADDPFSSLQIAGEIQAPESGAVYGGMMGSGTNNVVASGLLSLEFQIPEDGLRYDFVRSGGNASLALRVQPQDSVNRLQALIWVVICLVLLIVVLQGAAHGLMILATRLCIILCVAGLAGWLCTQSPLRQMAMTLFVVSGLTTCVLIVIQSRFSASADDPTQKPDAQHA